MQTHLSEKLEKLFSLRTRGIKPGLERINKLLGFLNHPEQEYPIIHVAGTNGKGSTCRIMHSILVESGYKTGLYTSPHLLKFNERIKVNHQEISDDELLELFTKFDDYMDESKASFFEITTAMALDYFKEKKVDIVVLEVGLGGRFDATNAVTPNLCVITSISKDHEEYLGNNILDIAKEKAGIIKENIPVISSPQTSEINKIIQDKAKSTKSKYFSSSDTCNIQINKLSLDGHNLNLHINNQFFKNIKFPMLGAHQIENMKTALTALSIYPEIKYNEKLLNAGFMRLQNRGRFEIIKRNPTVIYDVAHNDAGIETAINTVTDLFPNDKIDLLISFKSTKKIENIGSLARSLGGVVYITEMDQIESISTDSMLTKIKNHIDENLIIENKNMNQLLEQVLKEREKPLLILGSHYMAENVYNFLKTI
jgi:dihydrofolate synthase/folylpolyglutamate synthase